MSERKGLDLRTAAWELAKELENWTEYCNLQKTIQQQKQQLDLLGMVNESHKQAIAIIADLKRTGMTDKDLENLVKVVSKWSSKVGQGNGSSFELDSRLNLQNIPQ